MVSRTFDRGEHCFATLGQFIDEGPWPIVHRTRLQDQRFVWLLMPEREAVALARSERAAHVVSDGRSCLDHDHPEYVMSVPEGWCVFLSLREATALADVQQALQSPN